MANPRGRPPGRSRKTPIFNKPAGMEFRQEPPQEKELKPNFSLLTEDKKEELREQARVKVDAAERLRAEDAWLEAEMKRLEEELHPEVYEEEKEIEIDIATYPPVMIIDGRQYWHGHKYKVKASLYAVMKESMYRARRHYNEVNRNPMQVMQEAAQSISKGGSPGYATISAASGAVQRF